MRLLRRILRLPRPWRIAIGIALMGLGVVGLILPILQGMLILLAGAVLLSKDVPAFARARQRVAVLIRRWRHARDRRDETPRGRSTGG